MKTSLFNQGLDSKFNSTNHVFIVFFGIFLLAVICFQAVALYKVSNNLQIATEDLSKVKAQQSEYNLNQSNALKKALAENKMLVDSMQALDAKLLELQADNEKISEEVGGILNTLYAKERQHNNKHASRPAEKLANATPVAPPNANLHLKMSVDTLNPANNMVAKTEHRKVRNTKQNQPSDIEIAENALHSQQQIAANGQPVRILPPPTPDFAKLNAPVESQPINVYYASSNRKNSPEVTPGNADSASINNQARPAVYSLAKERKPLITIDDDAPALITIDDLNDAPVAKNKSIKHPIYLKVED